MRTYTIIGGVNGVGKSSFTGVLKERSTDLGIIVDVDAVISGKAKVSAVILKKVFLGLVIAILPTIVVLSLLSYDPTFSNLLEDIFNFDSLDLISHIILNEYIHSKL